MKSAAVRRRQNARRLACQVLYELSFASGFDEERLETAFAFALGESEALEDATEDVFSMPTSPVENDSRARLAQNSSSHSANEIPETADVDFARILARGVCEKSDGLDALVGAHSLKWRQDRIGKMELILLRLAIYEILYCGTPAKIVINETLNMAEQFGASRAKDFLNGILNAVCKSQLADGVETPKNTSEPDAG